jgi:squalene-associated FAD-dependent desaturase
MTLQTADFSDRHCLVIGAGIAGIAAAIDLVQAGWRVTLLEAKQEVGGRVYSLHDRETGETIDNGQHLLMGCYVNALHVLNALGTASLLRSQEALRVEFIEVVMCQSEPYRRQTATLDTGLLPGKAGMFLGMMRLQWLSWRERWRLVRFATLLQLDSLLPSLQLLRTQGKTALELLQSYGQPDNVIKRLWEPVILATLNAPPDKASATLLVEVLKRAFFAGRSASRLLLPRVGLSELVAPIGSWLERVGGGHSVLKQAIVSELLVERNRVCGVKTTTGEYIAANYVVSALPPNTLRKILPEHLHTMEHFQRLREFSFSPIVSVYLWFDRDVVDVEFAALLGTTIQWVFNRRKLCDVERLPAETRERFGGHVSLTISAGESLNALSNDEIIALCVYELRAAFPVLCNAHFLRGRVVRERMATPLLTPEIEEGSMLKPPARLGAVTPIEGLVLAGDWTATRLPATIESAAQSGRAAARAVMNHYKGKHGKYQRKELPKSQV